MKDSSDTAGTDNGTRQDEQSGGPDGQMGDVAGSKDGAGMVSGDFSLLSKGYTIENGRKGRAVEQITVAGNFYTMLKNIREVGSDLEFFGSSYGSPSVDVGEMTVAGK